MGTDIDLEEEKRDIRRRFKDEVGRHLLKEEWEGAMKMALKAQLVGSENGLGGPEERCTYIDSLSKIVDGGIMLSMHKPDKPLAPSAKKGKVRFKLFNRRFNLLGFVIAHQAQSKRLRINWKVVTAKWNEANPYDQYESPVSLRSLYNKARKEPNILYQLLFVDWALTMAGKDYGRIASGAISEFGGISEYMALVTPELLKNIQTRDATEEAKWIQFLKIIKQGLMQGTLRPTLRHFKIIIDLLVKAEGDKVITKEARHGENTSTAL